MSHVITFNGTVAQDQVISLAPAGSTAIYKSLPHSRCDRSQDDHGHRDQWLRRPHQAGRGRKHAGRC